jgi:hypothetical protein
VVQKKEPPEFRRFGINSNRKAIGSSGGARPKSGPNNMKQQRPAKDTRHD